MSSAGWEEFSEGIAARLPRLGINDVIILGKGPLYTQLIQLKHGLAVEAVASSGLPEGQELTAEQERLLAEKGWRAPARLRTKNWSYELEKWPLHSRDAARVTELMVSTLREVYGITDPADIEMKSFTV